MNYYDMLLQHQHRLADAEQRHQQDRHVRDLKRARKNEQAEETEQQSPIARVVIELKAALSARKRQAMEEARDLTPQPNIRVNL